MSREPTSLSIDRTRLIMKDGILEGDGTWPWLRPFLDGEDIVARMVVGTWFDDRHTASGVDASSVEGVALPLNFSHSPKTVGSPIPNLPMGTVVRVYSHDTRKVVEVPLIDIGPAKHTKHSIDLSRSAFEKLGLSLDEGVAVVDFRIIGGAKWLKK